ncbi:MAG: SurA N-terminal domain-containing protein, partial [Muribaculaceae bacterium]|nr:SurA N-terminal domain-containing protein [Muribaculaceae bacterium]
MATLEKIRSKSVFLIIVIGVALLAFIVGDAITNGRNLFGDHTTVAKVGGEKIDYTDYMRKREELNN